KMAFCFFALAFVLLVKDPLAPVCLAAVLIFLLLSIKIPWRLILVRTISPFSIAGIALIIVGYQQGMAKGLLLASRIVGAVSLILFLSMTTPVNKFLLALRFYRVPKVWVEVALLTYRYIFVFIDEAFTVMESQRLRLGYANAKKGSKSFGVLVGALLSKAYDQSNSTYQAMKLRGYKGEMPDV
ncbi:MAG: cobalt ECF transporter T component CbiQ, partial [Candidatus Omnitrophica bacterium]|nr:cobalt ECF transporter T component CbiQ [Candidatus Omnitrophota bacterium]